jgi:hypothetical protein
MIIKLQPHSRRRSGYALIIIMLFLACSLVVFGSMMGWVASGAKVTQRNNLFNAAQAAAESGSEVILSTMMRDFYFQSINPSSSYTPLLPDQTGWPVQYQFSNVGVSIGTINWAVLDSQYAGLSGFATFCTNTVTATAINAEARIPATVEQVIEFANIPIFQYAIFYNLDLEINPGAGMTINGHVHSNNNIWTTGAGSGSSQLVYTYLVDASKTINLNRSPNDPLTSGSGANVVFSLTTQKNPIAGVDSLAMPIGTNNSPLAVRAILGIPPSVLIAPNVTAYSPTGIVYLYNGADLIISNAASGTNISVFYDNPNLANLSLPRLIAVPPDVIVTNYTSGLRLTNSYYSFATNTSFWDYRESDTVKALEIDVNKLRIWLTNYAPTPTAVSSRGGEQYDDYNFTNNFTTKGHHINSVYVYNSIVPSTTTLPAVRLVNGQRLPLGGLTVATAQPLYVKDNYNTTSNGVTYATGLGSTTNGCTLPASIMGDAITILSGAWNDTWDASVSLGSRNATDTTINAACLEGIVESVTDSGGNQHYSGGVENFLRLLEDWGGNTLTYNGSIIVLFPSQYATNYWVSPGTYYQAPQRNWGFDANFSKGPGYLPPLTPQMKETIRSSWATK